MATRLKSTLGVLGFCAFVAFSVKVKREVLHTTEAIGLDSLRIGATMPDFTMRDRAGNPVTFSTIAARNKVVLVNFWGTWCGPCRIEMPSFERIYTDSTHRGFEILAIDEDDPAAELDAYLAKRPLSFPILRDSLDKLATRLGIRAFPTSILVDSTGKVLNVMTGVAPYMDALVTNTLKSAERSK